MLDWWASPGGGEGRLTGADSKAATGHHADRATKRQAATKVAAYVKQQLAEVRTFKPSG